MSPNPLIHNALELLAVVLLVLLNAFFVAAELALVRIRDTQLAALEARGNRRAKMARHIVAHIDTYISTTQFGITLVSMAVGVVVEPVFRDLMAPLFDLLKITSLGAQRGIAIGVGFFVNCYLLIVAGELVPKAIAIRRTLQTSLWVASPLNWFYRFSYPFIWLLHRSSQFVVRRLGFSVEEWRTAPSEDELRLVLAATRSAAGGRNLMLNALDLRHRVVREVMRPRHEITAFDTHATLADCLALAEETRYSRFPLCENGNLDRTLGVVHIKDLYPAAQDPQRPAMDLLPVARKLVYVPESGRLEKLLQLFLERKLHFAMVVDEYGGTVGVVTLENVLEELVGQIQDEFDQEKPELVRINENVWEAAGTLPLHGLEKVIGETPHEEGIATASGWLTRKLSGFPKAGDIVRVGPYELRVEEMNGPRVVRLKITKHPAETEFLKRPGTPP
ncbi:MAG TPA: hemolysin family protein [Verrucomicrobiae bacterium]|nr:hemolysin family protein [Verrucomicrobiae bacterium]